MTFLAVLSLMQFLLLVIMCCNISLLHKRVERLEGKKMGNVIHESVPVPVWVDIDAGIAGDVRWLNSLHGVRTFASCQGTIGEGGPEPYPAQIMAWWPPEHDTAIKERFEVGERGNGWSYLHPKPAPPAQPTPKGERR